MQFIKCISYNGIPNLISKFSITKFFLYVKICPMLMIRYTALFVISKFAVERVDCIGSEPMAALKGKLIEYRECLGYSF